MNNSHWDVMLIGDVLHAMTFAAARVQPARVWHALARHLGILQSFSKRVAQARDREREAHAEKRVVDLLMEACSFDGPSKPRDPMSHLVLRPAWVLHVATA